MMIGTAKNSTIIIHIHDREAARPSRPHLASQRREPLGCALARRDGGRELVEPLHREPLVAELDAVRVAGYFLVVKGPDPYKTLHI